ncbi:hypothetical protein DF186_25100, partial [Enterococcus hirae]
MPVVAEPEDLAPHPAHGDGDGQPEPARGGPGRDDHDVGPDAGVVVEHHAVDRVVADGHGRDAPASQPDPRSLGGAA